MPNYCSNYLRITGPEDSIEKFNQEIRDKGNLFSFHLLVCPDEEDNNKNEKNWGTKWDIPKNEQKEKAESLLEDNECYFDTAWSPPLEAIRKISKKHPEILFELAYHEAGLQFHGIANIQSGNIHDEYENEIPPPDFLKEYGWDPEMFSQE